MNPELEMFFASNGYLAAKELIDGRLACVMPLNFIAAIITMRLQTLSDGYDERYCFHSIDSAVKALNAWTGAGEPNGCHRHLPSNRRRTDGDPLKEYIHR